MSRTQTTMSNPRLPPEMLDYVIDLLNDEPEALKQCCLASKLWVPRTRRHLFADIAFRSADDLVSWKKTFPDPTNSPAYHARTVLVGCPGLITASDAGEGGWIWTFSSITSLEVDNGEQYLGSLTPFYQFAPTLKSLRVGPLLFPCPQLFALICSFPLLEDLSLRGVSPSHDDDSHGMRTIYSYPGTSPSLTGSLDLAILGGAGSVARLLLGLSSGLHFRKITFTWDRKEDRRWITELVASCSHTLESLDITYAFRRTFARICVFTNLILFLVGQEHALLDLSKATKLQDAIFRPQSKSVEWIATALQTLTPEHQDLRQISIYVPHHLTIFSPGADIRHYLGEASEWWSRLDHLLLRFWESRSVRPRVGCARAGEKWQNTKYCIGCLLPEVTKREIVDPV